MKYTISKTMQTNTIPVIYMEEGVPDYNLILPEHSFINIADLESPQHLAFYLKKVKVSNDRALWESYFWFKGNYTVYVKLLKRMYKYKSLKGLGYYTFTKIYTSGVCPVLDYASEIWGYKTYPCIDSIQNRAIRSFLGVHNFAPILAMNGDFGLTHSSDRRKMAMLRYWNRVQTMTPNRIARKIFLWDKELTTKGWASEMYQLFLQIGMQEKYLNNEVVSIEQCWALFHERSCQSWAELVSSSPKLRTYRTYKCTYGVEPYVTNLFNRHQRSVLAKLRLGILPLELEIGRWKSTPVNERLCT